MAANPDYIWYVSYGSNLRHERFMAYIEGGTAPGGLKPQMGCSDKTPPIRNEAVEIANGLYFGNMTSLIWGGAPAFVTMEPGHKPTKARAYLITASQFWEIVQDENHLGKPIARHRVDDIKKWGSLILEDVRQAGSNYARIIHCGDRDGLPMFTFTSAVSDAEINVKPPSAIYLGTVALGLHQSHGMDPDQMAWYLHDMPGIIGNYTLADLKIIASEATGAIVSFPQRSSVF